MCLFHHCGCVARVLSWGTCPHVICSKDKTFERTSTFVVVGTALVMISKMLSDAVYAKALLDAGCPPWLTYNCEGFNVLKVLSVTEERGLALDRSIHRHWWRWHARFCRRQWVCTVAGGQGK